MTKRKQLKDIAKRLEAEHTQRGAALLQDISKFDPEIELGDVIPKYLDSVDAALGLVERTLPGFSWGLKDGIGTAVAQPICRLSSEYDEDIVVRRSAHTAPLAILKAWVAAMFAQLEGGE